MNKKLTIEEVQEKIKDRGIELIGDYINSKTHTLFRCSNNHEWNAIPKNIFNGDGCPMCSNGTRKLTKKLINERLKDRGIEIIGEYVTTKENTLFRCSNNHVWETNTGGVLSGRGCHTCSGWRLTKEIINERIKDRGIELIGDYINNRIKSLFRCSNSHTWETLPASIVAGYGCPTCSGVEKLTKEIVNERIKDKGIELIGEYTGANNSSLFRCLYDHIWETCPSNVYSNGTGCPTCSGNLPLTKEIVNERIKDRGIELIGEFINSRIHSLFRCSNNHKWMARPNDVSQGSGCRVCSNISLTLTKEIVNERLKDRGIKLIGEYINSKHYALFRGTCNHEWKAKPQDVMKETGCPTCNRNFLLTKEIVNERIKDREIVLIGEYTNINTRSLFRGPCNHEWETSPSSVIGGTGCPICSGNLPLTKEIVNERLKDRGIELISDYINSGTRSLFRGLCNHEWESSPNSIMYGSGCPSCCEGGGFKLDKAGHSYLLDFGYFIKFGISNVLPRRLTEHKRNNGKFTVIKTKLFENGQHALDWENSIKKKYGGWYVTKDILPDGYTETLPMCFKETLVSTLDN